MKSMIVAYDQNRGIGRNGEMPWHGQLPVDLRHFKELTTGKSIIMGRKTFEAIGRPLPQRQNLVVSRNVVDVLGVAACRSLDKAYDVAESEEIMIIGGGEIYAEALASADRIYATEIDATFDDMDAFFPEIDRSLWHESSRQSVEADTSNHYSYDFVTYERTILA